MFQVIRTVSQSYDPFSFCFIKAKILLVLFLSYQLEVNDTAVGFNTEQEMPVPAAYLSETFFK